MAAKTANVLARVEPSVKEQAESIMSKLGVPASTVINMLYKQIIMTNSIPFPLVVPTRPVARDEMTDAEFDAMMQRGLDQARADDVYPADAVFSELRGELR